MIECSEGLLGYVDDSLSVDAALCDMGQGLTDNGVCEATGVAEGSFAVPDGIIHVYEDTVSLKG